MNKLTPLAKIVIAVLVVGGLIGGLVFATKSNKPKTNSTENSTQPTDSQNSVISEPATSTSSAKHSESKDFVPAGTEDVETPIEAPRKEAPKKVKSTPAAAPKKEAAPKKIKSGTKKEDGSRDNLELNNF